MLTLNGQAHGEQVQHRPMPVRSSRTDKPSRRQLWRLSTGSRVRHDTESFRPLHNVSLWYCLLSQC